MTAGGEGEGSPGGVAEALRAAIERTLAATAGSALQTRERAGALLDEVAQRGRDARDELAKRGQTARDELTRRGQRTGAGIARRGQEALALGEVLRRLEAIEERLGALEEGIHTPSDPKAEG